MEIDVKITRLGAPDSNVKAYVSATIGNCFAVRGMKLVEGKNGLFLSMPNYQKKRRQLHRRVLPHNGRIQTAAQQCGGSSVSALP